MGHLTLAMGPSLAQLCCPKVAPERSHPRQAAGQCWGLFLLSSPTPTPLQGILLALAPLLPASSSPSAAGLAGPPAQLSAQAPIPAAEQLSSHRSAQEGDIALGLAGRGVPRPDLSTQPCSPEGTSSVTALSLDGPRVGRGGLPACHPLPTTSS